MTFQRPGISQRGGKILYLAGESIGEKAYYLLTAYIKENEGLTQVMLRAVSDKPHGLNGFLNEIVDNLSHVVSTVQSAREIGVIKKEQVINIIDSVVQRTTFAGGEGDASVNIEGSVVQRTGFGMEEAEQKKWEEENRPCMEAEERLQKEKEEQERGAQEEKEQYHKEKEIVNSIGIKFTHIPAGEFTMGSPSGEEGSYDTESPVHIVTIEKAYYLGKYEVTQKQWREVMGSNPSNFKGDDLPIESVSWNDAREFVKKLNEKEGTNKYRLPSEAEWEYAARAGTTTRYLFGNDDSDLGDYAWYDSNSGSKTHSVGQKQPNPWGLYDMHGNVWEWVQDTFVIAYDGAPTDGSAWERGSDSYRVFRGGGHSNPAGACRSAVRYGCDPRSHSNGIGFRLLKEL